MAKILSFVNQKGGTGKTTSCINVASKLTIDGWGVLLIDLDPQANATLSLGINSTELKNSMYEVLLNHIPLTEILKKTTKGFNIAPASTELTNTDISLEGHQARLKDALQGLKDNFDYILIDCPPALNLLTINALVASDGVIIPILCDYLSMEGLKQLLNTVEKVKKTFNRGLQTVGILPNMVDHRRNLTDEVLGLLRKEFKSLVFKTEVPVCVALAEAPSFGKDIFSYASWSTGANAYKKVGDELVKRVKTK